MPDRAFEQLESRRLVLRRFADSDTEPFLAYRSDPETRRYQGWGEYTLEDAVRFVAGLRALHPDTQAFDVGDARTMAPLMEVVREHGLVLTTHSSEPVGHLYPGKGVTRPEVLWRVL